MRGTPSPPSSGTAGLIAALTVAGVGPGDEVIVSSYGWGGTAGAVAVMAAQPVFVDIDPDTATLDVEAVRAAMSPRTRAVLATHLFGHPADAMELGRLTTARGVRLIFDAAQALGARLDGRGVGAFGDISVLSFGQGKLLTTGEGGMALTNDADLYERLLLVTQHPIRALGEIEDPLLRALVDEASLSVRLNPIAAAIGMAELAPAASRLARRRASCRELCRHLTNLTGWRVPVERASAQHAFHAFALEYQPQAWDDLPREPVLAALAAEGVPIAAGPVRVPLHLRPRFQGSRVWGRGGVQACPVAERRCAGEKRSSRARATGAACRPSGFSRCTMLSQRSIAVAISCAETTESVERHAPDQKSTTTRWISSEI